MHWSMKGHVFWNRHGNSNQCIQLALSQTFPCSKGNNHHRESTAHRMGEGLPNQESNKGKYINNI